jgi:hypothetical protein
MPVHGALRPFLDVWSCKRIPCGTCSQFVGPGSPSVTGTALSYAPQRYPKTHIPVDRRCCHKLGQVQWRRLSTPGGKGCAATCLNRLQGQARQPRSPIGPHAGLARLHV